MSGFFGQVSRFAVPALAEQHENRLTTVFAAVLERAGGLALHLARECWLASDAKDARVKSLTAWNAARVALDEPDVVLRRVRTQRFTSGGWFVDLELRFGEQSAADADDVVVWVQAKHGARLHDRQLQNYLDDHAALGVRGAVVVLRREAASRSQVMFQRSTASRKPVPPRSTPGLRRCGREQRGRRSVAVLPRAAVSTAATISALAPGGKKVPSSPGADRQHDKRAHHRKRHGRPPSGNAAVKRPR